MDAILNEYFNCIVLLESDKICFQAPTYLIHNSFQAQLDKWDLPNSASEIQIQMHI